MRIALAQINPVIGDVDGNAERAIAAIQAGSAQRAELVVLPELTLPGYPPRDLLLSTTLVERNLAALERVAGSCRETAALVGFAEPTRRTTGRPLYNAAALCCAGRVIGVVRKSLLPNYDVFDEDRYFEPAGQRRVLSLPRKDGEALRLGVTICEDIWNGAPAPYGRQYAIDPIDELVDAGVDLLVNLSASPFDGDKEEARLELLAGHARRGGVAFVYVNQVGGNDDLVFDGASAVFHPQTGLVARAKAFAEDLLVVDLAGAADRRVEPYPQRVESLLAALVLGTRDYFRKCGFRDAVVGLSGGIDSALVAAIAAAALGGEHVRGVAMPSRFSDPISLEDARAVATNLGVDFRIIPIEPLHAAFEQSLAPSFTGRAPDITEENLQARIRGNMLMALANKFNALLLSTGNKSELAVGYCTLYGDMCGALAPIADVPKTVVYELARLVNRQAGRDLIPRRTLDRAPTAELRPDQTDQDSLPPYAMLDEILHRSVEQLQSAVEIVAAGHDPKIVADVLRLARISEYKRRQAAIGLKVSHRAFGTGRRMPVAAKFSP